MNPGIFEIVEMVVPKKTAQCLDIIFVISGLLEKPRENAGGFFPFSYDIVGSAQHIKRLHPVGLVLQQIAN